MVHVLGPHDYKKRNELARNGFTVINTTSQSSQEWTKGLSPFHLGPVQLYDGRVARNMENGWQFAKVYKEHIEDGEPTLKYWEWAEKGWSDIRAHRYPMGKGAVPEYSYWNGEKLSYVEARRKIYFPLYANAVKETEAFEKLQTMYRETGEVYLWDFDGYDYIELGIPLKSVIDIEDRKMGHAFVLALLLESGLT